VVLEAMAAGKPVVASRLPGLTEVIREGETGLLFKKGDDEGLAQAVSHLKHDREMARKMGEAGRRLVEARFDWKAVFRRTMETYQKALGEKEVYGGVPAR
jgi:glycosyltransferase involved in cell wall biosynthesis